MRIRRLTLAVVHRGIEPRHKPYQDSQLHQSVVDLSIIYPDLNGDLWFLNG